MCSRGRGGGSRQDAVGVKGGVEWGEGIPLPIRLGCLGSVVSSPSGVHGGAENEFGAFYLLQNPSGGRKIQCVYP